MKTENSNLIIVLKTYGLTKYCHFDLVGNNIQGALLEDVFSLPIDKLKDIPGVCHQY